MKIIKIKSLKVYAFGFCECILFFRYLVFHCFLIMLLTLVAVICIVFQTSTLVQSVRNWVQNMLRFQLQSLTNAITFTRIFFGMRGIIIIFWYSWCSSSASPFFWTHGIEMFMSFSMPVSFEIERAKSGMILVILLCLPFLCCMLSLKLFLSI